MKNIFCCLARAKELGPEPPVVESDDGCVPVPLTLWPTKQDAYLCSIVNLDERDVAWIKAVGFTPSEPIRILRRAPFGGPLHVRLGHGAEFGLAETLARHLYVIPFSEPSLILKKDENKATNGRSRSLSGSAPGALGRGEKIQDESS